jgi:hypothetical protein
MKRLKHILLLLIIKSMSLKQINNTIANKQKQKTVLDILAEDSDDEYCSMFEYNPKQTKYDFRYDSDYVDDIPYDETTDNSSTN